MTQRVEVDEMVQRVKRYLWLPVVLAVVGGVLGVTATQTVPPVHRSQATVLVGPTAGSVAHSSTIRASEDLATFYADMARREVVLRPVTRELGLRLRWDLLRNQVSATVPPQNLRLVQVTVVGSNQKSTSDIANAVVRQLVTLSPPLPGGNEQSYVNEQVVSLKATISDGETEVQRLKEVLKNTTDPVEQDLIRRQIRQQQRLVGDWQRAYVELISVEPSSDAGGLQVLDSANAVTDQGRSAMAKQAGVGAAGGALVGVVAAWVLANRSRRRGQRPAARPVAPARETQSQVRPEPGPVPAATSPHSADSANAVPVHAGSGSGSGSGALRTKEKDGPR
jgi:succinoglycan biosynthesis transport protein ExoP